MQCLILIRLTIIFYRKISVSACRPGHSDPTTSDRNKQWSQISRKKMHRFRQEESDKGNSREGESEDTYCCRRRVESVCASARENRRQGGLSGFSGNFTSSHHMGHGGTQVWSQAKSHQHIWVFSGLVCAVDRISRMADIMIILPQSRESGRITWRQTAICLAVPGEGSTVRET